MTFLYASEADETLERIDLEGAQNGIAHLRQLGFGGETTGSAFTDSEMYDSVPAEQWDYSFKVDR